MGTFIFKSKRVRKETFSSLFSYSVLLLSFFILIGCGGGSDGGGSSSTKIVYGGSILGIELSLSTSVATEARTGSSGSANDTGTSASFYSPTGITTDGTNLYVVERDNHVIRICGRFEK